MDYNNIDADKIVDEVYTAEAEGRTRPMTKQEIMRIRLAALSAIVRNMQEIVEKDYELVSTQSR
jgi:nicotinamide riboside kinase